MLVMRTSRIREVHKVFDPGTHVLIRCAVHIRVVLSLDTPPFLLPMSSIPIETSEIKSIVNSGANSESFSLRLITKAAGSPGTKPAGYYEINGMEIMQESVTSLSKPQ